MTQTIGQHSFLLRRPEPQGDGPATLYIQERRRSLRHMVYLIFAVVLSAFVWRWIIAAILAYARAGHMLAFLTDALWWAIPGVAISAYGLYYSGAALMNRIDIDLGVDVLSVRRRPLRWPKRVRIPRESIERITVQETKVRERARRWHLYARAAGGSIVPVMGNYDDLEAAEFVAGHLNRALGVSDAVDHRADQTA